MDLFVDAAVAAVDNVMYDLATRLFLEKSSERLSLVPVVVARAADVIPLANLALLLIVIIISKVNGKLPGILTPKSTIFVLLSLASLGWYLHPHVVNLADGRAHASLTLFENTPYYGLVYVFLLHQVITKFWKFPLISQFLLCYSGVSVLASFLFFVLGRLLAFFS